MFIPYKLNQDNDSYSFANCNHKGKCHCMADLLIDCFGFCQRSKSVDSFNTSKQREQVNAASKP